MGLGTTESLLKSRTFTATDAAEAIIARLTKHAETYLGVEIKEIVATCPANFDDSKKAALIEAYRRAGINVLLLMPEPTAAGYAYALDVTLQPSAVLVSGSDGSWPVAT